MEPTDLISSEQERTLKLFAPKHKAGFADKTTFSYWFVQQMVSQEFCCYYCETSILDIKLLISRNLLKTRATGYGARGPVLEVDKCNNDLPYGPANCVLICYYCNNDKSYTLDAETYKRFFGPNRKAFFEYLLSSDQIKQ